MDGEVIAFARRVHKFVTLGETAQLPSAVEYRNVWEVMCYDRNMTASLVVTLVTKLLVPEDVTLQDAVVNLLADRPLNPSGTAAGSGGAAAANVRRGPSAPTRQQVLNSLFLIGLHYPIDPTHSGLQTALRRWTTDLSEYPGDRDVIFENEIISMFTGTDTVESEKNIVDFVLRATNINTMSMREEIENFYANSATIANNRISAESIILPFLVACVRRGGDKALLILRYTASQLVGGKDSLGESRFIAILSMIREFLVVNPAPDNESLELIRECVRPFFVWRRALSNQAVQMMKFAEMLRKSTGLTSCWNFLEHHPSLLGKIDGNTHIIINTRSLQGSSIKELLREYAGTYITPEDDVKLRCKFIYVCFKNLLSDDTAIYSMAGLEMSIIQPLFDRILEIIRVAAQRCWSGQQSHRCSSQDYQEGLRRCHCSQRHQKGPYIVS